MPQYFKPHINTYRVYKESFRLLRTNLEFTAKFLRTVDKPLVNNFIMGEVRKKPSYFAVKCLSKILQWSEKFKRGFLKGDVYSAVTFCCTKSRYLCSIYFGSIKVELIHSLSIDDLKHNKAIIRILKLQMISIVKPAWMLQPFWFQEVVWNFFLKKQKW